MNCAVLFYSATLFFGTIQSVPIIPDDIPISSIEVDPSGKGNKPGCQATETIQCNANYEVRSEENDSRAAKETQPTSIEAEQYADPEYLREEYEPYIVESPSYVNIQQSPITVIPQPPRVSYYVDPHIRPGRFDYRDFMRPYMYSRYFGPTRLPPVNTLPPVYTTQIHGLTPLEEELEQSMYEVGDLDSGNTVLLPRNLRLQRMSQTRADNPFDDILKELASAAIMPNILPSMSIPFLRNAGYQVPQEYSPELAVYPSAVGGCAQPVLLSCSPKVVRGTLVKELREEPSSGPAYQHNTEHVHASHVAVGP